MKFIPLLTALSFLLASCAGYHVGPRKPPSLSKIESISINVFENDTLHPRVGALATSAVASAMTLDGTYKIVSTDQADAVLEGTVRNIRYDAIRSRRFNSLRPEELNNLVTISWVLRDAKDATNVLANGTVTGESQLFVASNLQTARQNALPEALERAAESLVSKIANGF